MGVQDGAKIWQVEVDCEPGSEMMLASYGEAISGHLRRRNGEVYELLTLDGVLYLRELARGPESAENDSIVAPAGGIARTAEAGQRRCFAGYAAPRRTGRRCSLRR